MAVPRRGRTRALLLAVAALAVVALLPAPAQADDAGIVHTGDWRTGHDLNCGYGQVTSSSPSVHGSPGERVWWLPQLWAWTSDAGWQPMLDDGWRHSYVDGDGATGHIWTEYETRDPVEWAHFRTVPGYWFAVRNWVYYRGHWHSSWAVSYDGRLYCLGS